MSGLLRRRFNAIHAEWEKYAPWNGAARPTRILARSCRHGEKDEFRESGCPIARSLDVLGDWWSLLIIRDAFGASPRQRIPEETRVREEHPERAAAREKGLPMPRMIDKCAFEVRNSRTYFTTFKIVNPGRQGPDQHLSI
jgi:hypothetical protein